MVGILLACRRFDDEPKRSEDDSRTAVTIMRYSFALDGGGAIIEFLRFAFHLSASKYAVTLATPPPTVATASRSSDSEHLRRAHQACVTAASLRSIRYPSVLTVWDRSMAMRKIL